MHPIALPEVSLLWV
ncbi:UNVERIFIED_CONTAM: hypothetical protein GTU68_023000 [Idotea baltica]|nr:hypothetical protein [Idotea baltica]